MRHIFTYFLCYSIGSASNNKKLHCSPSFIRKNCKEQWYTRDDNRKIFKTFNLQGNVYWHAKMQIWKKSPSKNYIWFLTYSYRKIFKFNYWWLLMNWWRSYALISMNFQYFLFLNYLINDKRRNASFNERKKKQNQSAHFHLVFIGQQHICINFLYIQIDLSSLTASSWHE